MSSLLFDLRLIVRGLWRRPGFTIAATVPLALAMGANTTLFHITDALVLQPRALMDSQNLYVLWETSTRRDGLMSEISYPDFLDWRRENRSFQNLAAMGSINWSHGWSEGGRRDPRDSLPSRIVVVFRCSRCRCRHGPDVRSRG